LSLGPRRPRVFDGDDNGKEVRGLASFLLRHSQAARADCAAFLAGRRPARVSPNGRDRRNFQKMIPWPLCLSYHIAQGSPFIRGPAPRSREKERAPARETDAMLRFRKARGDRAYPMAFEEETL